MKKRLGKHKDPDSLGRSDAPSVMSALDWLSHFLTSQWKKVSGLDAQFFDHQLAAKPALLLLDGLDEVPTEAQWERAARGTEGWKYPWGNRPEPDPQLLNFSESNTRAPTPVGVYPQGSTPQGSTGQGIADLAGNVLEWCQDWFGDYPDQREKNPAGYKKGTGRVLRGGAWLNSAGLCRCSFRFWGELSERNGFFGFRVVLVSSSAKTL